MQLDKPPSQYVLGQLVRVLVNERNKTPRSGSVCHIVWHHNDSCYNYYIEANGKKVSKRYLAKDLSGSDL